MPSLLRSAVAFCLATILAACTLFVGPTADVALVGYSHGDTLRARLINHGPGRVYYVYCGMILEREGPPWVQAQPGPLTQVCIGEGSFLEAGQWADVGFLRGDSVPDGMYRWRTSVTSMSSKRKMEVTSPTFSVP